MKAITTYYKGYKFRSRLEARWAVYFDSLGIEWEYEFEGFEFSDGTRYLPDFWLPGLLMFVEIKPIELTEEEERKCILLTKESGHEVLILIGTPKRQAYLSLSEREDFFNKNSREIVYTNQALSNYHNYPSTEGRFYSCFDDGEIEEEWFDDIDIHVKKSRAARFEFGESGYED